MTKQVEYSPEVRERAVRMVSEQSVLHSSQWAAIESISSTIGCTPEPLRRWVRQTERDSGQHAGLTTSDRERLKALERENVELKRVNEILRKASAFSPRRNSTANPSIGRFHRNASRGLRGRTDLC